MKTWEHQEVACKRLGLDAASNGDVRQGFVFEMGIVHLALVVRAGVDASAVVIEAAKFFADGDAARKAVSGRRKA